jgi:pSer/pThr/pTyr-binding forkhead associated (FHA) protein
MNLHNPDSASYNSDPGATGSQGQMELAAILQMCCLSRHSGQITFHSGQSYGYVFLQQGKVLHAVCGVVEGEEAVYLMLTWPAGGFTLDEDVLPHKRTIELTWEQLIFEGARRADIGMTSWSDPSIPVTTAEPETTTRSKDSLPRLIISRPDQPQFTFELSEEYTHVGRADGNEIHLPYPSVSNRHCIFLLSGSDVVVRDLNSSNGTFVNGEPATEAVLRPGDSIMIGIVQMKFEPGVRRPKLNTRSAQVAVPAARAAMQEPARDASVQTARLPDARRRPAQDKTVDDMAFVTGQSAISYQHLAPTAPAKKSGSLGKILLFLVLILALAGGAAWYFLLRPGH